MLVPRLVAPGHLKADEEGLARIAKLAPPVSRAPAPKKAGARHARKSK